MDSITKSPVFSLFAQVHIRQSRPDHDHKVAGLLALRPGLYHTVYFTTQVFTTQIFTTQVFTTQVFTTQVFTTQRIFTTQVFTTHVFTT